MGEDWKGRLRISWYLLEPLLFYALIHDFVLICWEKTTVEIPAGVAAAAAAAAVLGLWYQKEQSGKKKRLPIRSCAVLSLAAVLTCVALNRLLSALGVSGSGYDTVKEQVFAQKMVWQITGSGLLIPLAEELVFRGLGYQRLRRELDARTGAVFTAVLFGIYHGNLIQGIYAGLMGLLLAAVCEYYQNLTAPWLFHAAANITAIVMTAYGA